MADASIYFYEAEIEWVGGKDLQISSGKLPVIAGGAPPEFKGRKGVWAPEHLFVAALNSCYLLTLLAIAEMFKSRSSVARRARKANWKKSRAALIKSLRSLSDRGS